MAIRTTGSTNLYSSIVSMASGGRTRHHHGPCETSIYIRSGGARYTWGPTGLEDCPDWLVVYMDDDTDGMGDARDARATEAAERCLA